LPEFFRLSPNPSFFLSLNNAQLLRNFRKRPTL